MHSWNRRLPTILIGACLCTSAAFAQTTMEAPVGEFVDFAMDSGSQDNVSDQAEVLFEGTVHVDNAAWIRLYFTNTVISPGIEASDSGYIRITSALDGDVQELNAADLQMWNDTSAYFNGDTLYVELIGAAGSTGNRVGIAYVAVEYPVATSGDRTCGICDHDNRVPSAEDWTARTLPVGCTASVYNEESCMVTAGHCSVNGGDQVAQFRVPASNGNCSLNHPPAAEQFPITGRIFGCCGTGNDWSVLTTGTNNVGQKPFDRYGVFVPIAAAPASVGDTATITGYGTDLQCTRSQTQQTHTGRITAVQATLYRYLIDMTFGNSGSDVVVDGECVAINTHCQDIFCPNNFGTRVDRADFAAARARLCPAGGGQGACCLPDGTCADGLTRRECIGRQGRYQGDGTDCRNVNCGSDCCENVKWDNDIVPNGFSGRAISPPNFPDIRVTDDFIVQQDCRIDCVHANIIEDAGWTPGNNITVTVRRHDAANNGPVPGAAGIVVSVQSAFTRTNTGDIYFGREDFDYCILLGANSFNLAAGHYWVGLRNAGGGGSGTNYWMTSDGGQAGTSTGWFSLDAGATFNDEGAGWDHAFEIGGTPIGADGACCLPGGDCVQVTREECADLQGRYQGDGTDCRKVDCRPMGACCLPDGSCVQSTREECADQQGRYQGDNTDCRGVECPLPEGACCLQDGNCVQATREECINRRGDYQGDGTDCANVECPQPEGACCLPDGNCVQATREECANRRGDYQGDGTDCANVECPLPEGACCLRDGNCVQGTRDECIKRRGAYQGDGTDCANVECPQPEGACCLPDGNCVQATREECANRQGDYQGDGTDCANVECPRPGEGACCHGDECDIRRPEDCISCEKCDTCECDVDCDGVVNPVDSGICQSLFGSTRPEDLCKCDIDCDGQINPVDSGLIQSKFGTCEPPTPNCSYFGEYKGDGTDCEDPDICRDRDDIGACCLPGGGGDCDWDNNIVPDGFSGRALSPPNFPDIRVADDFRFAEPCKITSVHANIIEDDGWTDGGILKVIVYANAGGQPGAILTEVDCEFTKMDTGDVYFGRRDFDYWCEDMSIQLGAGSYWLGLRNPGGGGAGTNYWMTSDGIPDGIGSSTGFFSLDAGNTWMDEGAGWHHAFEIVTQGGGGEECSQVLCSVCDAQGGDCFPGLNCDEIPCGDIIIIPPGEDCWVTNCDDTKFNFCVNPIPADFFDPGSAPYDGVVRLGGPQPGEIDTKIMRLEPMVFPNEGFPQRREVPIEIVELDLVSCEPITVMVGNEEQLWDVEVSLSDRRPPPGQMTVTKEMRNGGTYEAEFLVQPVFTFIRKDDGTVRVLDTGESGIDPDQLGTPPGGAPWVHALRNGARACGPRFAPNVREDDKTGDQCCEEICHRQATATHCIVVGHDCSACPEGACCPGDGTPCFVATAGGGRSAKEVCEDGGGEYKGDGTDCSDTDEDGLPDVYENNDCPCEENDECNTGTDPLNPDTDGDGCSDGDEVDAGTDPCDPCDYDPACVRDPCGACCDRDGTCSDDVPASECDGRHFPETPCSDDPCGGGACCIAGAGLCDWDNNIVPDGFSGRALSPPNFPDIRVADDFRFAEPCKITSVHANIIEDDGWTDGGILKVIVYANAGGQPGAILTEVDCEFTKMDTGDVYFGRRDFDYWCEDMSIQLGAGSYWLGLRNPGGGGAGTNYWMTSDGIPDGIGSSTGFFSLDAGNTWNDEGAGWHHAFHIVTAGGDDECVDTENQDDCDRLGGRFLEGEDCADDPCR